MSSFDEIGEEPKPAAPEKRAGTPKNKGNRAKVQGVKSEAKIIEDAKKFAEAEAKAPNIMGGVGPVRKPSKFEPFRTHPTLRINVKLCMPKKGAHEGDIFLVAPHMKDLLVRHTVSATLFLLMTAEGAPLLAPVPFPEEGGKEHTANSSFRIIAARAEKEWCLAIYSRASSSYELGTQDETDFGEPVWPDLTLAEILEKAFRDLYIQDRNHPFVKSVGLGPRA